MPAVLKSRGFDCPRRTQKREAGSDTYSFKEVRKKSKRREGGTELKTRITQKDHPQKPSTSLWTMTRKAGENGGPREGGRTANPRDI